MVVDDMAKVSIKIDSVACDLANVSSRIESVEVNLKEITVSYLEKPFSMHNLGNFYHWISKNKKSSKNLAALQSQHTKTNAKQEYWKRKIYPGG